MLEPSSGRALLRWARLLVLCWDCLGDVSWSSGEAPLQPPHPTPLFLSWLGCCAAPASQRSFCFKSKVDFVVFLEDFGFSELRKLWGGEAKHLKEKPESKTTFGLITITCMDENLPRQHLGLQLEGGGERPGGEQKLRGQDAQDLNISGRLDSPPGVLPGQLLLLSQW